MSNQDASPAPVAETERIAFWDILRGFAVLGVLLANMPFMSFSEILGFDSYPLGPGGSDLDQLAFFVVRVFADTKFITIFSVLFGAGLGIMSEKAIEQGDRLFEGLYLRRLGILAAFGVAHALFLWFGDILFHYALVGAAALFFRRMNVSGLCAVASVLLGIGIFMTLAFSAMGAASGEQPDMGPTPAQYSEIFRSGDTGRMIRARASFFGFGAMFMLLVWGTRTLGLFLLGIALVKSRVFVEPARHRARFQSILRWSLLIGLPINLLYWYLSLLATKRGGETPTVWMAMSKGFAEYIAAFALSPGYVAAMVLLAGGSFLVGLRDRLAAVGRMALTNYLTHSFITCIIFCYFGQYDHWGRFDGLLLCIAIFVFQLAISPVWLRNFHFGPVEWLWRSATYFRLQPFRKTAA